MGKCPVCGDGGGFHDSQVHLSERLRISRQRAAARAEAQETTARGTGGWIDADRKE